MKLIINYQLSIINYISYLCKNFCEDRLHLSIMSELFCIRFALSLHSLL